MPERQPALRFDHREIAVIFSLFVFVALLMFTVGILVGKGLTQAKYEGTNVGVKNLTAESAEHPLSVETKGTHVTTNDTFSAKPTEGHGENEVASEGKPSEASTEPLKLVPQKANDPDVFAGSLKEPKSDSHLDNLMRNPKLMGLIDGGTTAPKRSAASKRPDPTPDSSKYIVQVGSYTSEKDAGDRVDALKKLGFPEAYHTRIEVGDKKDTWYRVWLGTYSDLQTAKANGEMLQERGEVKNFLVRKTETN